MTDIRRQTVADLVEFLKTLEQEKPIEVVGSYVDCEIVGALIYKNFIQLLPDSFDDTETITSSKVPFIRIKNEGK